MEQEDLKEFQKDLWAMKDKWNKKMDIEISTNFENLRFMVAGRIKIF